MRITLLLLSVLCTFVIGTLFSYNALAALNAKVDRDTISPNESFQLHISSDDNNLLNNLNLSQLDALFTIAGRSTSQQVQIVNGTINKQATLILTLFPNQSGTLVIPALTAGGQSTQPISINVGASGTSGNQGKQNNQQPTNDGIAEFFLTADNDTVYAQQQLIVTIRLHLKANSFSQGDLGALEAANVQMQLLGEQRYESQRNNQPWITIERRYAAFPQQSGKVTIPPVTFQGVVVTNRNSFFPTGKNYRIRSNPLTINVKPPVYTDAAWLPANNFTASSTLSANQVQEGQAITRTITLQVRNQLSEILPEIALPQISGVQGYQDGNERNNQTHQQGIDGTITTKQVFIPDQPGSFIIAAQQISWFNLRENRRETLTIPESRFRVTTAVSGSGKDDLPIQPNRNGQAFNEQMSTPASGWIFYAIYSLAGLFLVSVACNIWLLRRSRNPTVAAQPPLPNKESELFTLLGNSSHSNAKDWMSTCNHWLKTIGAPSIHSAQGLYQLIRSRQQDAPQELQSELEHWLYNGGNKPTGLEHHLQVIRHAYGYPRANGIYNAVLG